MLRCPVDECVVIVPTQLPATWKVKLGDRSDPSGGATLVDLTAHKRGRSLAVTFVDEGADAFGLSLPVGDAVVVLPSFPTLDDVWTLYMLASCERDEALRKTRPSSWESISHYAEQVRQGFVPERVAPERSVQAVLRSISSSTLPSEPDKFLHEALRLCELVAQKVTAGAKLLDEDLVGDEPRLQRHIAFLQEDTRVYREDVQRGRRFVCELPARETEPARSLPLLVIPRPKSQMFKLWARRDTASSDGNGYALLLVDDPTGEIVLSSDPARRVPIGWLATTLDAAETARGGTGAWYDGARHEGTLVASPRGGTKLSLDDVVDVIGASTKLKPVTSTAAAAAATRSRWIVPALASAAALGAVVVALFVVRQPDAPSRGRRMGPDSVNMTSAPPYADPSQPRQPNQSMPTGGGIEVGQRPSEPQHDESFSHKSNNAVVVSEKLKSLGDARDFEHYAIIVGVCSYGAPGKPLPKELETHELLHPCNNAWEFANLLVHDYHYKPQNIVLMIDNPKNVDRPKLSPMPEVNYSPTRNELTKVIENWSKTHDAGTKKMTLVFYYSGHGMVVSSEDAGLPYLQLANWEADIRAGQPRDIAGFPMDRITRLVKVGIPAAKHVLYLFDNCHAGWALSMGAAEKAELQKRWADGITYGIAASAKDQSAWEPGENSKGLSAFTETLIKGLELRKSSAALADLDDECGTPDHVVTHVELENYLRREVPKVVSKLTSSQQVPVGHRFDGEGQFLFVAPDAEDHLGKRSCAKSP